jgi:hypothetical protein
MPTPARRISSGIASGSTSGEQDAAPPDTHGQGRANTAQDAPYRCRAAAGTSVPRPSPGRPSAVPTMGGMVTSGRPVSAVRRGLGGNSQPSG